MKSAIGNVKRSIPHRNSIIAFAQNVRCCITMGRKPEFKVSKAFTIGMQEAGFIAEKSHSMGMKASQYINYLVRQAMLEEQQQAPALPQAFCNKCSETCPFDFNNKEKWVCVKCGDDRTDYIEDVIKYSSKFKRR